MASACSTWIRPSASAVAGEVVVGRGLGRAASRGAPAAGELWSVGVPVRGRGGTGLGAELGLVGVGQQSGLQLGELGLRGLHLCDGGGGLGGVHRPQRHVGDIGQF